MELEKDGRSNPRFFFGSHKKKNKERDLKNETINEELKKDGRSDHRF